MQEVVEQESTAESAGAEVANASEPMAAEPCKHEFGKEEEKQQQRELEQVEQADQQQQQQRQQRQQQPAEPAVASETEVEAAESAEATEEAEMIAPERHAVVAEPGKRRVVETQPNSAEPVVAARRGSAQVTEPMTTSKASKAIDKSTTGKGITRKTSKGEVTGYAKTVYKALTRGERMLAAAQE